MVYTAGKRRNPSRVLWQTSEDMVLVSVEKVFDGVVKFEKAKNIRAIVSNDSLGLHLAFALGKKAIGLFGATDEREIYFYNQSVALKPKFNMNIFLVISHNASKRGAAWIL